MSVDDAIAAGRELAESLMDDTCLIRRRGADVLNPTTLLYDPAWVTVYDGPCELRYESTDTQSRALAGQLLVAQQLVLKLPYDASAGVAVDDQAVIAGQGITVRIAGRFVQTHATTRRLPVEALT